MVLQRPFHVSPRGGYIVCLEGLTGRIFRTCYANFSTYTSDLHSAKSFLDFFENKNIKSLPSGKKLENIPAQRKTTLKWDSDGSLSYIDMARILNRLDKASLTECELSCQWKY